MGVNASAELKAVMEQQLAEGKATALAHLILANQCIKAGRLIDSIPHLELTLKSAPNHPVALNNLSLALALTDASKVPRSEELIAKAISVDGRNPELYDSQGQIRIIAGRPLDAVESLEKAISIDPKRLNTRELMVKAYREAGLEDLAKAQEKSLAQLKAEAAKPQVPAEPGAKPGEPKSPVPAGAPASTKTPSPPPSRWWLILPRLPPDLKLERRSSLDVGAVAWYLGHETYRNSDQILAYHRFRALNARERLGIGEMNNGEFDCVATHRLRLVCLSICTWKFRFCRSDGAWLRSA